jgi:MFS family permease
VNADENAPARGRWTALALLSFALLLGMAEWFTATAVGPALQLRWDLSSGQVSLLTTLVQIGFVAGTLVAAVLNLADVLPIRIYFAAASLLAAAANAGLLVVDGFAAAAALRFTTGFALAGVYPPAMKMCSTWFLRGRGLAIGAVVGALTVGKAAPWLIRAMGGVGEAPVILGASAGGVSGALLVLLFYRDGPHAFARRPFDWGRVGEIVRDRPTRLATLGYVGHMWELYAMWSLTPAFVAATFAARGWEGADAVGFGVIAVGGLGAVLAGWLADRLGRARVASGAMVVSGACATVVGFLGHAPAPVLVGLVLIWGFSVVADSAQFSALVTEVAPSHAVGTALTFQTMVGFAVTAVAIEVATRVSETLGWGPAFLLLALGPLFGIEAMRRFTRARRAAEA